MTEILSTFLVWIGIFIIGVAAAIIFLCWLSVRNYDDNGEGCFGTMVAILATGLVLCIFYLATMIA